MQQERDDLDGIIMAAVKNIKVSDDYNEKLIMKLEKRKPNKEKNKNYYFNRNPAAAFSLIVSGLLLIFIGTTNFENRFQTFNSKVKTQLLVIQYDYNYKFENIKNNIGGWY